MIVEIVRHLLSRTPGDPLCDVVLRSRALPASPRSVP